MMMPSTKAADQAQTQRRALQRNVDPWSLFILSGRDRFNGDSTQRRRRRHNFRNFENSRPLANRFRKLIRRRRGRSPGKPGKLYNFARCGDVNGPAGWRQEPRPSPARHLRIADPFQQPAQVLPYSIEREGMVRDGLELEASGDSPVALAGGADSSAQTASSGMDIGADVLCGGRDTG